MRIMCFALAATFASACTGGFSYSGYTTHTYMPLDGARGWEYLQDDPDTIWTMNVDKVLPEEKSGDTVLVTLEHSVAEPVEVLYSVVWSSDSRDGILIHGYTMDDQVVNYDPPVVVADYQMSTGDSVETSAGGMTFTSTLQGLEDCPNGWIPEKETWECLHFVLDDGDGDSSAGPPFAGEYWMAPSWGISRFVPTGYTTPWVLAHADWDGDTSG